MKQSPKIITIIMLLVLVFAGNAQQISVKWLPLDRPSTGGWKQINGFVGKDETGAYYFEQGHNAELVKLSNNKVVLRKTLPPIGGIANSVFFPRLFLLDGRLWLLANSRFEKEDKSYNVFAQEIDKSTLTYKGDMLNISKQVGSGKFKTTYELILSTGSDKYCYLIGGYGDAQYLKVFNSKMEMVRDNIHFEFGFSPTVFYSEGDLFNTQSKGPITSIVTDNDGNVFINFTAKSNHVYAFLKNAASPIIINLDKGNSRSITTLQLNGQQLVCAGFNIAPETGLPEGTLLVKINPKTGEVISERRNKLNAELLSGLPAAGMETGFKFGPSGKHVYDVHHFLFDGHEGVYLSFEHHAIVQDEKGNTAQNVPPTRDDYKEICVVHLADNGDILWHKTIPRWLRNENSGRLHPISFYPTVKDGKYYLFYIDHPDNITKNNVSEMKYVFPEINQVKIIDREKQFGAMVVATIDEKGNMDRKIVELFKEPLTVHPLESLKLSDHQFLLSGYDCGQQSNSDRFKQVGLLEIP